MCCNPSLTMDVQNSVCLWLLAGLWLCCPLSSGDTVGHPLLSFLLAGSALSSGGHGMFCLCQLWSAALSSMMKLWHPSITSQYAKWRTYTHHTQRHIHTNIHIITYPIFLYFQICTPATFGTYFRLEVEGVDFLFACFFDCFCWGFPHNLQYCATESVWPKRASLLDTRVTKRKKFVEKKVVKSQVEEKLQHANLSAPFPLGKQQQ